MNDSPLDKQALKSASVKGAAINLTSQMVKFVLMFLNQVLMARLLMPADFGLLAMVAPIMAFVVLFADLGLTQATIQRPQISQTELSFLFWTNVSVSSALACVMVLISPLVAAFYNEPRVLMITIIMGLTLIITGLNSQHIAILTRNMKFKKLAFLDLGALLTGFAAGWIAALQGLEYWSLVIVHVTIYLTNLIAVWFFSKWRPSRPQLPENWKSLLSFGGNLSGFNFVNYFARNLDNVLIGRVNGEVPLGLYDRAYKLLLMPLQQVTMPFARVALPLLSRTREDPPTYKKSYLRMVEVILLIVYPGILYAVIDHDNLIRTVLGDKWAGVGPIFCMLGLSSFLGTIAHTTGWLFISQDRTRDMRNWGIFSSAVIICAFFVGLPWGPLGVATAYFAVTSFQAPIVCWAATRTGPVAFKDLLLMFIPYALSCAITGAGIYLMAVYVLPEGVWAVVTLLPFSYLLFVLSFMILPRGRKIFIELMKHAFSLFTPLLARYFPRQQSTDVENEPY